MKKLAASLLFILPFIVAFQGDVKDMCNDRAAKEEATKLLADYSYSTSKTSNFFFINNEQVREIEINLFEGEDYRLVFNNNYLPENVEVRVYDKPKEASFRKMLFSSEATPGEKIFIYDPSWRHRNLYINYIVPPSSSEEITKGCAVMVMGYKLSFVN